MADDSALGFDLFGNPIVPRGERRGRKAHAFDREYAENIAVLSAAGMTQAEISGLIGLSEKTLRKYYSRSLDSGAELTVGATILKTFEAVKAGKVGAMRLLLQRVEGDAFVAPKASRPAREPRQAPLGKKVEAQLAGESAHVGTEWEDLLRH